MKALSKADPSVLEVQGLTIRRGQTFLLRDIDWRISRRQHWVILGANGSGKTSLLSALTGYLMPTAGKMSIWGEQYGRTDWRELRKHIGLVSSAIRQLMADAEPALRTVISGQNAMIDLWGPVSTADRDRALRILKQIECAYLADRLWLHLSQGERQRVLIGRALMARPRMLILDEPCAGLDPAAREHFLQFLQRLGQRRGAPTLVLVTHHVEEIMPVFSHVLVLKKGRVLAAGPKQVCLCSDLLSDAFDCPMRLSKENRRYALKVAQATRAVI